MSDIPRLSKTDVVILNLLRGRNEMYGLEMAKESDELNRTSIYVYLARLTDKGFVDSRQYKEDGSPGMPRRLYKITGAGSAALNAHELALSAWTSFGDSNLGGAGV